MSYLTSWVWVSLATYVFIYVYQFISAACKNEIAQDILKGISILHSKFY